jgi:hypothetical protein
MKPFNFMLVALLGIATIARAQEGKLHLRDFTPKYTIDTFQVRGESASLKRSIIQTLRREGIKSAYWDEASALLTVQYNQQIISLSSIKAWFLSGTQALQSSRGGHKAAGAAEKSSAVYECCAPFISFKN